MIAIPPGSEAAKILESNPLVCLQEVEVFWEPVQGLPSTFYFPFIVVSVTKLVQVSESEWGIRQLKKRTVGSLRFEECAVDLYSQILHPSMRDMIEKQLFANHYRTVHCQAFKTDLARWHQWLDSQPQEERPKLVTIARNTSGTQILG